MYSNNEKVPWGTFFASATQVASGIFEKKTEKFI